VPDEKPIYESDAQMRPDSEFVPADLDRLVVGNKGRLLDARRTPITVVGVVPERGEFMVRVEAFEDTGTTWELFLGEFGRFQFDRDAAQASAREVDEFRRSVGRFDRELVIEPTSASRVRSQKELRSRRERIRERFGARLILSAVEVERSIALREGHPRLYELTEKLLEESGLGAIERDLLVPLVSNPRSGEMVKGHAIVLAELGVCPYRGRVVRDPGLFAGDRSKEIRAEHVLWRMALTQELWSSIGSVPVYRAVATDEVLRPTNTESFVSATFSREVAESHFEGGPTTKAATLMRQGIPMGRLFVTFLETRAMNERFREAEAMLIGADSGVAF
jgi:hypothetical protein